MDYFEVASSFGVEDTAAETTSDGKDTQPVGFEVIVSCDVARSHSVLVSHNGMRKDVCNKNKTVPI